MSQGSPRVTVRLSPDLLAAVDHVIGKYNACQTCREPLTMSDFVVKAVVEKLQHMERSRKPRQPKITLGTILFGLFLGGVAIAASHFCVAMLKGGVS